MESKVKFLGHPVHPILIVFPLGLLIMALIFDVIYLATSNAAFATAAYWDIAAGIIGGLLAAVFGLIDWLNIPSGTRAKAVGMWHGLGNVVVVALFALSWWLRYSSATHTPSTTAFILALIGIGIGAVTGWSTGSESVWTEAPISTRPVRSRVCRPIPICAGRRRCGSVRPAGAHER
jgi:uncharacterized membrane protein